MSTPRADADRWTRESECTMVDRTPEGMVANIKDLDTLPEVALRSEDG